ncbi:FepA family TonB-dependent siderophore receptor [Catenovulum sp. 2E275]|uniref:FepA family TonB-dependent siderophore receptor n=1 Tax=Catenovulum sp. 2E275 TaxID=2980497 RepID=UPI0021CF97C2|nr:FepA family TonB-dependent siderophore receptor [Catenovulum sp. 2E275]MCU4676527.1 FepA family TonB-dependent siderophore receptor [Catenovulum sp. 2E275]
MFNTKKTLLFTAVTAALSSNAFAAEEELETLETTVVQAASEELKQAQGVSVITEEEFKRRPVTNDIAELVKTMPGINLTGNSSSGQYGNKRQIDIRGMGPENTLILIDGKPVLSRNSVKMGRSGERNTQGDSNWVPPEAIESIEVIRGPAAARYGSGASGGVINIITKSPEVASTSITLQTEIPENEYEGSNKRINIVSSSPLTERFSQRTVLSYNKQEADDPELNLDFAENDADDEGNFTQQVGAGREGVENIDFRSLVRFDQNENHRWDFEFGYSRQGNEYAGDNAFQGINVPVDENGDPIGSEQADPESTDAYDLIGEETTVMQRRTFAVTHNGTYDFGDSFSYIQYEGTSNTRLGEGAAGGGEGRINSLDMVTIKLANITAKTEWNIPLNLAGFNQTATFGAEIRQETLEDGISNQSGINLAEGEEIEGTVDAEDRPSETDATLIGLYVEDNIMLSESITLTPGIRFDNHSEAGTNVSPSLNASWQATPNVVVQGGISRAFKAPNLYQLNPNYVYTTRGNGCPVDFPSLGSGCSIVGNPDLSHETSINKELGINYTNESGLNAGITYFHNDYKDKIGTGNVPPEYVLPGGSNGQVQVFKWYNVPEAVISGLEGNLLLPITESVEWSTNFTVMLESEDKQTGQPLSIVPDYTVNSLLSWQATDALELVLSAQHYGKTESPTASTTSGSEIEPIDRDAYTIVNFNSIYQFNENLRFNLSVKNFINTEIKREGTQASNAGANTYNEPGRSFLISATYQF